MYRTVLLIQGCTGVLMNHSVILSTVVQHTYMNPTGMQMTSAFTSLWGIHVEQKRTRVGQLKARNLSFSLLSNAQAHPVVTPAAIPILKYVVITVQLSGFMFEIHIMNPTTVYNRLFGKD